MTVAQNFAYCGSDCTRDGLPSDGVTVIASMLHAHNFGMALNLRHVRDGIELEPIDSNWNYDFDYQSMITHSTGNDDDDTTTTRILPGDDLILECYYDTSDANEITYAGEESASEMCYVYLYVYPKPELSKCRSTFAFSEIQNWVLKAKELGYLNDDADEYYSYLDGAKEYYQSLWWNTTSYTQSCQDQYSDRLSTVLIDKPEITNEYQTEICGKTVGIDVFEYWYPRSTTPWVQPTETENQEDATVMKRFSGYVLFSLVIIHFF